MSLNHSTIQGRIPFDHEIKGTEGNEYLGFRVSVRRNYKPEGEQYYPEDLIPCKAFKSKAAFIARNFPKGSQILLEGELRMNEDYIPEGGTETVKGQMYFLVTEAHFCGDKKAEGSEGASAPAAPKATTPKAPAKTGTTPPVNPLSNKKKGPF